MLLIVLLPAAIMNYLDNLIGEAFPVIPEFFDTMLEIAEFFMV
jgi:hypothetical protein